MNQQVVVLLRMAAIFSLISLIIVGCGRRDVTVELSASEHFERGMEFYEDEDYSRAVSEFRIVTRQFSGSEYADDAQYYMGLAYLNRGEYILAANEFERLVNTMSGSPLVANAQYKLALSYFNLSPRYDLDQEFTYKAIDEFQAFVDFFPTNELVPDAEEKIHKLNEKLARKQFENAKLYMRMRYYRSATRYYEIVIEQYHDTEYAESAHVGMVEALMAREMYDEANETIQQFHRRFPNSDKRSRMETLQQRIVAELEDENDEDANNGPDIPQTTTGEISGESEL